MKKKKRRSSIADSITHLPRTICVFDRIGKDRHVEMRFNDGLFLTKLQVDELISVCRLYLKYLRREDIEPRNQEIIEEIEEARAKRFREIRRLLSYNRKPIKGYIYLAHSRRSRCCKIGFSEKPEIRVSDMLTTDPSMWLVATMPGFMTDELKLHQRFVQYCVGGEWFQIPVPLIKGLVEEFKKTTEESLSR